MIGGLMAKHRALVVFAAALLAATAVSADPTPRTAPPESVAAESQERGRDQPAQHSGTGSFKRDVKQAWADAGDGARKTGRAIGDGARSFGRATRDAAVNGWRKVKAAFSG
jgi:hypothetical protein